MSPKIVPMLAVLLGIPGVAGAQTHPAGPPGIDIAALQQREADDMALLLLLRPAQRPALDAFLRSLAPPPPVQRGEAMRGTMPTDGFEQHLQRMTEMTARHAADETRRIAAARSFYDGLDATQRAAFEAVIRLRRGPPMMGPPMMGAPMMGPSMMGPAMMGPPMMGPMPGRPAGHGPPGGGPFLDGPVRGNTPPTAGSPRQAQEDSGGDR